MTLPQKIKEMLITANDDQKKRNHELQKMGYHGYWGSVLCRSCDHVFLDIYNRENGRFVTATCTTVSCLRKELT